MVTAEHEQATPKRVAHGGRLRGRQRGLPPPKKVCFDFIACSGELRGLQPIDGDDIAKLAPAGLRILVTVALGAEVELLYSARRCRRRSGNYALAHILHNASCRTRL